jgi:STE24 endopeptidase
MKLPLSVLIALWIAFGIDTPAIGVPPGDVTTRVLEMCGGITLVAILAFGLGFWVSFRVSHIGYAPSRLRRRYGLGVWVLTVLSLVVYAWIIHYLGWSKLVRSNWGLNRVVILGDFFVFLPHLLIQLLVSWGLFYAERALHVRLGPSTTGAHLVHYLVLRARQALGLVLPIILMYVIRRDVLERFFPAWDNDPLAQPVEIAVLGSMVLAASPFFVRMAWPTRSLPAGPLRRRLERIAQRLGFRCTDVLVWDTGFLMVNACVTGLLPGYRYVLLSDALIESLSPKEVAAVFGHEIGHVAHRHLPYFAFFFVGSLGVLALLSGGVAIVEPFFARLGAISPWSPAIVSEVLEVIALLAVLGLYFWLVFGALSRRFERQADVFGGKVVSCTEALCPPHYDLDVDLAPNRAADAAPALCPVGIRIFADALAAVARANGQDQNARSWRHGTIASRIAFLEGLERHPEREQAFQRGVKRLRLGLGAVLAVVMVVALVTQALDLIP